ncbi:hypothetical protein ACN47E_004813 [Coniothyrium glycines]
MATTLPSRETFLATLTPSHILSEDTDTAADCPICQEPFCSTTSHHATTTPCNHTYGSSCLKQWLSSQGVNTCALCRRELFSLDAEEEWESNGDDDDENDAGAPDQGPRIVVLDDENIDRLVLDFWEHVADSMGVWRRARKQDHDDSALDRLLPNIIVLTEVFLRLAPCLAEALDSHRYAKTEELVKAMVENQMCEAGELRGKFAQRGSVYRDMIKVMFGMHSGQM